MIKALSEVLMAAFVWTFLYVDVSALIDRSECNMKEYPCPLCIVQVQAWSTGGGGGGHPLLVRHDEQRQGRKAPP